MTDPLINRPANSDLGSLVVVAGAQSAGTTTLVRALRDEIPPWKAAIEEEPER